MHEETRANGSRENGTRECNLRLLKCQRFLRPDRKCLLTAVAGARFYTAGFRFAEIRLFGKPIMRVKMFVSPRGGAKEAAGIRYGRSVRHASSGLTNSKSPLSLTNEQLISRSITLFPLFIVTASVRNSVSNFIIRFCAT